MDGTANEIRALDERTVERIAAGEVVERPASAVKELVENAVDADAGRIDVVVEEGGIDGIRVADDGVGMDRDSVRRAVRQHTTSKIEDVADLERGVGTLGFRGEALHAIGAVSRLTIRTRPRDGGEGTELRVEGGDVVDVSSAGRPPGTTVEVADLFHNVPARRKYLAEPATEFAHVNTVVTNYALANPATAVSLTHGDRETFATTGQGGLRETVLSVYGREVAGAMLPVGAGTAPTVGLDDPPAGDLPDGPLDGVAGLVSHPETNRAGREYCSTFVNGRSVRSSAVREAVVEAYGDQLAPDRYPFAAVFLSVPAGDVDVNVHPRKREVRFVDEDGLREQVRSAVEDALLEAGLVRSSAPRGRSAPEQTEIDPGSGGDAASADADAGDPGTAAGADDARSNAGDAVRDSSAGTTATDARSGPDDGTDGRAARPDDGSDSPRDHPSESAASRSRADRPGSDRSGGNRLGTDRPGSDRSEADRSGVGGSSSRTGADAAERAGAGTDGTAASGTSGESQVHDHDHDHGRGTTGDGEQSRLGGGAPETSFDSLPALDLLGQYGETYVVAESEGGLVLIDQHAADERINYERLRESFAEDVTTQALAEPVELPLTAGEAAAFDRRREALARLGFRADLVEGGPEADGGGDDTRRVRVRTVPSLVAEPASPELLWEVLGAFVGGGDPAATVEAAADGLLADLACHPSITGNTSLTEGSIRDLLDRLDDCENPYACPHGRPTIVEIDADEIEDRFERDYPGHGG